MQKMMANGLSVQEHATIEYWRPTDKNQTCECAGDRVCAPHALIAIIDRLLLDRVK